MSAILLANLGWAFILAVYALGAIGRFGQLGMWGELGSNRRVFDFVFNSDMGEWEREEQSGSGLITVEGVVTGVATTTIATITTGFKGVVTMLKISYGGNAGAAPVADFTLLEATSTTIINIPQEAAVHHTGGDGIVLHAVGSLRAPVLELAAGAVVIQTANAADQARVTMTYKEQGVTPN